MLSPGELRGPSLQILLGGLSAGALGCNPKALRRSRELALPLQSVVDPSPYACNAQRLSNAVSRNASLDQLTDLLLEELDQHFDSDIRPHARVSSSPPACLDATHQRPVNRQGRGARLLSVSLRFGPGFLESDVPSLGRRAVQLTSKAMSRRRLSGWCASIEGQRSVTCASDH